MRSRREKQVQKTKASKKWKIRIGVIASFTLLQWGAMYGVDRYLQPSVPTVATPVQAASTTTPVVTPVNVPSDAVRSALSQDQQHAAYTTADQHLVIADKAGTTFDQQMNGDVLYMQWLGNSNTLLYFVQGSYLDAWLLPLNSNEPVLIHEWWGKDRQVQQTYFSSYMEYLYVELENESQHVTEVYKYDAIGGISQLPLENVQIDSIEYDDKNDIMQLTDRQGGVWRYEKDRLYRPDGSQVYQSVIVNHPLPTDNTATLTPTPGTETDKNGTGKNDPGKTDPTTKPGTGCAGTSTGTTGSSGGSGTAANGTGTAANGTGTVTGTTGTGVSNLCSGSTTGGTNPTGTTGTTGGTGTTTGTTGGTGGGTNGNTNPPSDSKTGGGGTTPTKGSGNNNPPPPNGGGGSGSGGGGTGGGH